MDRRTFLKLLGTGGAVATLTPQVFAETMQNAPVGTFAPSIEDRDPMWHFLSRSGYGVTPSALSHVQQQGLEAYIAEQIAYEPTRADYDSVVASEFPVMLMNPKELLDEFRDMRGRIVRDVTMSTVMHRQTSSHHVYERMVEFWSDHFSVSLGELGVIIAKVMDDRDAMRPNAFATFGDLLSASAHSPAMLLYLDNFSSEGDAPNENYARELLELHTLGVNGGYTEDGIKELARVLTGWTIVRNRERDVFGTYQFRPFMHATGDKQVLGQTIANGGENEGVQVLELLAQHPSTAQFISRKLTQYWIGNTQDQAFIDSLATTFTQSGGDVRALLQTIFASPHILECTTEI